MLRDWFPDNLQALQSTSQPERRHNHPAMDMQCSPRSFCPVKTGSAPTDVCKAMHLPLATLHA
uniref:Uncharacterized protein n=1 Tax=Arundo donax TaxID=35708 RepID=A0A0A9DCU5_ARUDO